MDSLILKQMTNKAVSLQASGDLSGAEDIYRQILNQTPAHHASYHALGLIALEVNKPVLAADLVAKAVELGPDVSWYQSNLCEINRRLCRLPRAIQAGQKAVELDQSNLNAHYNLALALSDAGQYKKAEKHYKAAVKLDPNHGLSWNNLGSILERQGSKKEALFAYSKAVALNPDHAEARNNMGAIYTERGELDQARSHFEAAVRAKPDFIEAHHNLSSLKTYTKSDPHLIRLEQLAPKLDALPIESRIRYFFALGKAREDTENFEGAFKAFAEGNSLQHSLNPGNEDGEEKLFEQLISHFTPAFFQSRSMTSTLHGLESSRIPVFIVGMPRSGTTLIEQILSSHPQVYGAGELGELNHVIMSEKNRTHRERGFGQWMFGLSHNVFSRMGRSYLDNVWEMAPDTMYITDKMPANFFYCGLIYFMFPQAKIIHSMRDPMDSCLSCYARLFNDSMHFAYDLKTLGRYFSRYMELMAHWHKVLPKGAILDVRYEENVKDIEAQTAKMLDFIGLPWDSACLEFYKSKRQVKTASHAQVRKPIYTSSVEKWKRYENQLAPLYEIVKKYRKRQVTED